MTLHRRPRGTDGFTIVELLVAVLVLSVLAAIALPSFLGQAGKADGAVVKRGLEDASVALESCRVEAGTYEACAGALADRFDGTHYAAALDASAYVLTGRTDEGAVFTVSRSPAGTEYSCTPEPSGGRSCRDGVW